jgi:hypothetical protein
MLRAGDSEDIEGWYGQGSHSSIRKTHKSAVMHDLSVPKESRQHRQRVIGEGLIDEIMPARATHSVAPFERRTYTYRDREDL